MTRTDFYLKCDQCGFITSADLITLGCSRCEGLLSVNYDNSVVNPNGPQPPDWSSPPIPLPLQHPESYVSIGEGNTRVVRLTSIGQQLGLLNLWGKLEFSNPTGSFKDRGTAVMISVILEQGGREVVEDSSGNAGASVAAYAARSQIKAHIFAPDSAPLAKLNQIEVYGAETHLVPGPREAATEAAVRFSAARDLIYATHNRSPYFIEGTKSFAYEVTSQFGGYQPDHIVFPVGNGSLYLGAWKGFQELENRLYIGQIPALHVIQSCSVMPVVSAFNGNSSEFNGLQKTTIAGGIAVASPPRLFNILDGLSATRGTASAVTDTDTLRWQLHIAQTEGIYVEPTSAVAIAGLELLVTDGVISPNDRVLVPLTGFGLKDKSPI